VERSKLYVTTPIYYVNSKPHIGHAYTTIAADVLARNASRSCIDNHFVTGSDENSLKNVEAAKKAGRPVQEFIDELAKIWASTWDDLGIEYDTFIRTSQEQHIQGVLKFWETVKASGDLYKGTYEGLYCPGCEAFISANDLNEAEECPAHLRRPDSVKEDNYFFRASKYKQQILDHIATNPDFISPKSRRNEVIAYIKEHFDDISVSRQALEWGIPVPGEPDQVIYVWFDALINYLTAVGYGWNDELFAKWWPADLHLVGKDIIKFHCALWPAMLLSAGLPLPKQVFAHGFFTIDGQKIGKSLGNAIDPLHIAEKYGNEALRYYLFSKIPFGNDGDFSFQQLEESYNADLANTLGNLASRVAGMSVKYFDGQVDIHPDYIKKEGPVLDKWVRGIRTLTAQCRFKDALWQIMEKARECNKLIDIVQPWVMAKEGQTEDLRNVLGSLAYQLVYIGYAINPYLPETGRKLAKIFSASEVSKLAPLFPKKT